MRAGQQAPGLSFWEHGRLVAERFHDLLRDTPRLEWRWPRWWLQHGAFLRERLRPDLELLTRYQQWHDCGKPFCRVVDEEGRARYPDHANVSAAVWRQLGGDALVAELIERDMECHLLRPDGAIDFARRPHALALLATALCELHANASLFGGVCSDGFKIKFKRLDRCGSLVLDDFSRRNP